MSPIDEKFGSRIQFLIHLITMLSMNRQPCDLTFYKRKPPLDVIIDHHIHLALAYGASVNNVKKLFERIRLSNGDVVSLKDIWTINPMPKGGFSESELAAVDLAEAEERVVPGWATLRKMISDTYHCDSREEEDRYLRRFIAS